MNVLRRCLPILLALVSAHVLAAEPKRVKILDPLSVIDASTLKAGYSKISIGSSPEWEHPKFLNVDIDFAKSDFGGVNKSIDPTHVNASRYKGIRFFAKSPTATLLQVTLAAKDKSGRHLLFKAMAPVAVSWSEVLLPYSVFEGSASPVNDASLSKVSSIFVSIHKRDNGENAEASLQMDGLGFIEK